MPADLKPRKRRKHPRPCYCPNWWFPHRRGCKYCVDYPKILTDEDWENHPANRRDRQQQR